MHGYRSVLFVPGHKPGWAPKALKAGPDAIVLDLEDSVPDGEKVAARDQVRQTIATLRAADPSVGIFVRVNGLGTRLTGGDLHVVGDGVLQVEHDSVRASLERLGCPARLVAGDE